MKPQISCTWSLASRSWPSTMVYWSLKCLESEMLSISFCFPENSSCMFVNSINQVSWISHDIPAFSSRSYEPMLKANNSQRSNIKYLFLESTRQLSKSSYVSLPFLYLWQSARMFVQALSSNSGSFCVRNWINAVLLLTVFSKVNIYLMSCF